MFNRLNQILSIWQYLTLPYERAIYSGFVGHKNLGDEALWQAIDQLFKPLDLYVNPTPSNNFAKKLLKIKKHRLAILGGGTLIGSNLADGSNPFRNNFRHLHLRSQKSITFGTGVGKASANDDLTWLVDWKPILEKCFYIGVRGPDSFQTLNSIGLKNIEVLGDSACYFTQKKEFWTPKTKKMGVNLGVSFPCADKHEKNMIEEVKKFLVAKIQNGWEIDLFVVCPRDLPVAQKVLQELGYGKITIHAIFENPNEYLTAVRSVSVFIGVKLHSVILAMCAGIPSIMIEYSPKCLDFMKSVEMEKYNINLKDVDKNKLEKVFQKVFQNRMELNLKVHNNMNYFQKKQLNKAKEIIGLILEK